jgi:MFS transporter, PPP family, 3-phenylpropionic acid transporter
MQRISLDSGTMLALRLSAMHGVNFVGIGLYLPFFPLWLSAQGLDAGQIALIMSASTAVRIVSTPLVSSSGDGRLGPIRIIMLVHGAVGLGYLALGGLSATGHAGLFSVMGVMCFLSAAWSGLIPLADVVTTGHVRTSDLDYGRVRVWGSITFLLASIVGGWLIDRLGIGGLPWWLALCALAGIIMMSFVPAPPKIARTDDEIWPLRHLPGTLICVMLGSAAVQASHGMLYSFGSIHWSTVGYAKDTIGFFWALAVAAEILLFYLIGRGIADVGASLRLMLIGAMMAVIRFALMPYAVDPSMIILVQLLHGLSFGATHLGMIGVVSALAPKGQAGRTQGLTAGLHAAAMAATMMACGVLYARYASLAFWAMVPIAILGIVLIIAALTLHSRAGSTQGIPLG